MSAHPGPGYSALSRGRFSAAGEQYFLTFNLERPHCGLTEPSVLPRIREELQRLESAGAWGLRCGVIMPDHIHLLVRLGGTHSLAASVRMLKGRLAPVLRRQGLAWQRSFFDHRLRHDEDGLPVFLYILLNPYRAGLARTGEDWRGYFCSPEDWVWFAPLTDAGAPFPEWLEERGAEKRRG